MSNKAERWLEAQEVALLERIYALDSPPDREDKQDAIWVEARKVQVYKPATDAPSNGAVTG